jgi:GNAT superfamily N-acetyltransferase
MTSAISSISIRPATLVDLDSLIAFNAAMAQETENKRLDLAILRAGTEAVFAEPQRGFYIVAECCGRVVGCLLVTYEWSDWRNGDWWWVQSVYVAAEFRRQGVFRALYCDIEARARSNPGVVGLRLYVEWENARAQSTYAALGMQQLHYHMYQKAFAGTD